MVALTFLLLLVTSTAPWVVIAECYLPNGVDRNETKNNPNHDYQPCNTNSTAEVSMCCNVGVGDVCREDGLCYNPTAKLVWRESCTDPTWGSPNCLKLCADDVPS